MKRSERGAALVWALMLTMIAAALGSVLLTRSRALAGATQEDAATLRALHAAEGGLAHARVRLAADPGYAGETLAIGACRVEISVDGRQVRCRALPGNAIIEAELAPADDALPAIRSWRQR